MPPGSPSASTTQPQALLDELRTVLPGQATLMAGISGVADAADLTARLIRCPSVTPEEGGALTLIQSLLEPAGFACTRVDRNGTPNLFARWGAKGARTFGFNGHTDVVPPGDPDNWTHPPFSGAVIDGTIWGRGATDMKSGVAAFVAAAIDFVTRTPPDGAVILTVTGDEEGPSRDGTPALLDWMDANGERMDVCIVGEPSNPEVMGEMIKIGRRGSLTATFTATGKQGHAAYPHRALNPLHALVRLLAGLTAAPLDEAVANRLVSAVTPATIQLALAALTTLEEREQAPCQLYVTEQPEQRRLMANERAILVCLRAWSQHMCLFFAYLRPCV